MSSNRLALALAEGKLVVINRADFEVSISLVRFETGPRGKTVHKSTIVVLPPGKERELTRSFTVPELRASGSIQNGLESAIRSGWVQVVQTW